MTSSQINQSELRERMLFDLGSQNLISLVLYPVVWAVLVLQADLLGTVPHFFWPNLVMLAVTTSMRVFVHSRMRRREAAAAPFLERLLVVTVLLNASQWSAMTIWALLDPQLEPIRIAMLLVVTGIAGSGTFAVAFITTLRIFFPLIVLVPAGITMLLSGDRIEMTWGALCLAFLGYVLPSARRRQQDYITAVSTALLLEQRTQELEQISFTDAVTGLHNRNYFDAHLELEWKRAQRLHYPLSLLLIDLDHFKHINDRFGHPAGDRCLQAMGECLARGRRRAGDILARIGGDEFAILLVNADAAAAASVAAAVCADIGALLVEEQGQRIPITSSIGVASATPTHADPLEAKALIGAADGALYAAKAQGRNQWQRAA